jgi:hypothetical protein
MFPKIIKSIHEVFWSCGTFVFFRRSNKYKAISPKLARMIQLATQAKEVADGFLSNDEVMAKHNAKTGNRLNTPNNIFLSELFFILAL